MPSQKRLPAQKHTFVGKISHRKQKRESKGNLPGTIPQRIQKRIKQNRHDQAPRNQLQYAFYLNFTNFYKFFKKPVSIYSVLLVLLRNTIPGLINCIKLNKLKHIKILYDYVQAHISRFRGVLFYTKADPHWPIAEPIIGCCAQCQSRAPVHAISKQSSHLNH